MRRTLKVLLGFCLLAVVVFGSIKIVDHYESQGRSPYEKLEDELEQEDGDSSTSHSERYLPGDPDCRAREAPGTVGTVGEDVTSGVVRVRGFVACYGQPMRRSAVGGRDCLYYRQRDAEVSWKFCVRDGRIVSALASLDRPG